MLIHLGSQGRTTTTKVIKLYLKVGMSDRKGKKKVLAKQHPKQIHNHQGIETSSVSDAWGQGTLLLNAQING